MAVDLRGFYLKVSRMLSNLVDFAYACPSCLDVIWPLLQAEKGQWNRSDLTRQLVRAKASPGGHCHEKVSWASYQFVMHWDMQYRTHSVGAVGSILCGKG